MSEQEKVHEVMLKVSKLVTQSGYKQPQESTISFIPYLKVQVRVCWVDKVNHYTYDWTTRGYILRE